MQTHFSPAPVENLSTCRFCAEILTESFVDLGMQPLCESFKTAEQLNAVEHFFPLHPKVCGSCFLVQAPSFVPVDEIFREYAYYSSFSTSFLAHCKRYVEQITDRLQLDATSFVCELASNDGYMLQYFLDKGPKTLGIEPSYNCAADAEKRGVRTITEFFGTELANSLAESEGKADLIIGNNVLAQVPQLNDFVAGMATFLAPGGTITMEWPHVLRLIALNQFDTIYHEHFGYFSLLSTEKIFATHGLRIYDVDEIDTHGGSLRIYATHQANTSLPDQPNLAKVRHDENQAGLDTLDGYRGYAARAEQVKNDLLTFLIDARKQGKKVVGYGAPGKGNTLLNFAGIRSDLIAFLVDRNPYKHGRFTPGTNIPIFAIGELDRAKPDYVVVMPWNLRDEIVKQLAPIAQWGAKCVLAIPHLEIVEPGAAT
jgi:predicted TPR repeat methyltransferase